jgi:hypothetical protein
MKQVRHAGLGLSLVSAFATTLAASQSPVVLVDYLHGGENPVKFSLNPADIPGPVLETIDRSNEVWLWTEQGQVNGVVESVEKNEEWKTYRGGLILNIRVPGEVKEGWAVLSFQPFPPQTWTPIEALPGEKAGIAKRLGHAPKRLTLAKFEARDKSQYLVADYWLPCPDGSAECGDYNEVETTVFRGSARSGWERLYSFVDGGSRPFVDVDGDGIPEVVGSTGYQGYVLRRIVPAQEIIVVSKSGV